MLDRSIEHLYPPFALHVNKLLQDSLADVNAKIVPYHYVVNEGFRSLERQRALFAQGRTTPGPRVTQLQTSLHSAGLAVDLVPVIDGVERWDDDGLFFRLGYYANRHALHWGGSWLRFKDLPHLEPVHVELAAMLPRAIDWCASQGLYPLRDRPVFDRLPA